MFTDEQVESIVEVLLVSEPETKIYLGCDSVRFKRNGKPWARYATVCIIHIHRAGRGVGCRLFSHTSSEPIFEKKINQPRMRMMREAHLVTDLAMQLLPLIDEFGVEIHLDINTDPKHGSSVAAKEAANHVMGYTGIRAKLKPESFAASFGADHIANGKAIR